MGESNRTYISLTPFLAAMIEQEARETGNSLSSIIRRRVLDSYRREAAELGHVLNGDETQVEPSPQ